MSDLPQLGPRAINAYNRLSKELAAFNYVLLRTKASGPVSGTTLFILNGLIFSARRLFRRHADMPLFFPIDTTTTMTLTDLSIYVHRLNSACLHFEERYAHLNGRLAHYIDEMD